MPEFTESELARAEGVLNLAMMNLGGEAPSEVYDQRGYKIWLMGTVQKIANALTEDF